MEVRVTRASARATWSWKLIAQIVGWFVGGESGKAKHESLHSHSVVSNGHYGFLKEERCCFACAGK